jgi:glycosyltransferase involved in cell wall biosynthesis
MTEAQAVSIVVATRCRVALLRECLDRLLPQLSETDEIVLVDDDPAGSAAAAFSDIDPRVSVMRSAGSGPAAARNCGIRASRGDIVAFTDDDVLPADTWLQAVRETLAADPEAVGVEGPIVSDPFDMVFVHSVASDGPGAYYTANVAYRALPLKAEQFDEGFAYPYGEDLDLGFRMLRHGRIRYADRMSVRHRPRPLPLREFWGRGRFVACDWVLYRRYPEFAPPRLPMRWKPCSRRVIEWGKKLRDIVLGRVADTNHRRLAVLARATLGGGLEVTRALMVTLMEWRPEPGDAAASKQAAATLVRARER